MDFTLFKEPVKVHLQLNSAYGKNSLSRWENNIVAWSKRFHSIKTKVRDIIRLAAELKSNQLLGNLISYCIFTRSRSPYSQPVAHLSISVLFLTGDRSPDAYVCGTYVLIRVCVCILVCLV